MKKLVIILVGLFGWIVIITTILTSFISRAAWGMGFTDMIMWTIWEHNDDIQPDSIQLWGIWQADDGATIQLNGDGTCLVQNAQKYTHDPYMNEKTTMIAIKDNVAEETDTCTYWNFNGYWCIKPHLSFPEKDTIKYAVYLSTNPFCDCAKERKSDQRCYTLKLLIHNKKRIFSREITPSSLYSVIGAFDPYDAYVFNKK